MGQALLKLLAVTVAVLFLVGAVLTRVTDIFGMNAFAGTPPRDAGASADSGTPPAIERAFFPATKAAVMPRPRARDGGEPVFFPASKSGGGEALPGVKKLQQNPAPQTQQSPQQNAAP